jgi:tetratricopeptide (TPR) repeat protein
MGEAWSLLAMGRAREARPIAEQLVVSNPGVVDTMMLVAAARANTGDPAAALSALDQARTLAPQRPDVHQQIGDIARSLGDNEGAIAAYRRALELDSEFAVVRFQLARLLRAKGLVREAEHELEHALDAVPTYAEATLELASLRLASDHADVALQQLISLLERDPYHFDALLALGETLLAEPLLASELEGLRARLLAALDPAERERVGEYDRVRGHRVTFEFEDASVLESFARGWEALPPAGRARLRLLGAKAVAAGLAPSAPAPVATAAR